MTENPEWVIRSPETAAVNRLVDANDYDPTIAAVLTNRELTDPEEARQFLNPTASGIHPPTQLPDLQTAVERLEAALYVTRHVGVGQSADEPISDEPSGD